MKRILLFLATNLAISKLTAKRMVGALEKPKRMHEPHPLPEKMAAFGISGGQGLGLKRLFMTHPPLERVLPRCAITEGCKAWA